LGCRLRSPDRRGRGYWICVSHVPLNESVPGPPTHTSVPAPPFSASLPPPATRQSSPPFPLTVSPAAVPSTRSLPFVPVTPTTIVVRLIPAHSGGLRSFAPIGTWIWPTAVAGTLFAAANATAR